MSRGHYIVAAVLYCCISIVITAIVHINGKDVTGTLLIVVLLIMIALAAVVSDGEKKP